MEETISTILIAELINPPELIDHMTVLQYEDMLGDFQNTVFDIVTHHLECYGYNSFGTDYEWSIMGEELRVFLYSGHVQFDIRNALLIAAKIKIAWLISNFTQNIVYEGHQISHIGVGINCGKVIKDLRPWRAKIGQIQPNVEGYVINLTRHIQLASREGSVSQILVGQNLYKRCQLNSQLNIAFSPQKSLSFRGFDQKIPIYEVVSFINFEIIPSMPPSLQGGILKKIEHIIKNKVPEPWLFIILLRSYISQLAKGDDENLAAKAVDLAQHALEVLDYKVVIYNMLGWLYNNCKSVRNLKIA